ncbi:MAG TPA: CRTAC1 family protein [Acidobacteriaceae bacterium]|nr:CRTAC1 family protein [Acidobacteriaceae bacterium]
MVIDSRSRLVHLIALMGILFLAITVSLESQQLHRSAATPRRAAEHAQTQEGVPRLIDITASTRIQFNHLSAPEKKYIVESMSGGVALIDFDRDGWPDIYFTNAPDVEMQLAGKKARSALFHNNRDGTFTDVTDKAGVGYPCWAMGAAVGDYDNDGWPDLLVTCFNGVVLYHNNGDWTFTDATKQTGLNKDSGWATGAAFGDYDNDGRDDLFVPHYVKFDLSDLPEFGSKITCTYHKIKVQCGPRGLPGSPDALYHNNGDGTFTDVAQNAGVADAQGLLGLGSVWSHFNGSDHIDLFVANDSGPNYLYRNNGDGTFSEIGYNAGVAFSQDGNEQANMGIAVGDYNHTGRDSIFVSHFSEDYGTLWRNEGKMSFTDVSYTSGIARSTWPYVGWGDAFVDLENTGWLDLFLVNGHVYPQVDTEPLISKYKEPKLVFRNQRNGEFKDVSKLAGEAIQLPQVSRGVAAGDLFNDGRIDLVIENLEGQPMILRPEGLPHNHWISLELAGTKSNRLALNARVEVIAGTSTQTDEVRSGGSYMSQSDLRLHFGLAEHIRADKVKIIWPSGATETFTDLPADHFYCMEENAGIVACAKIRPPKANSTR